MTEAIAGTLSLSRSVMYNYTSQLKKTCMSGRPRKFLPSVRASVTAIPCTQSKEMNLPLLNSLFRQWFRGNHGGIAPRINKRGS
ncbi:MAG: hypothetical protein AB4426_32075 [Xenococcaceae cyanobacterium]